MAYMVFISHSMRKRDLRIINELVQQAHTKGIHCYLAERDPQYGKSLAIKIENAIRNCDCFVAFWTKGGAHSTFVSQEIGVAVGAQKPRILVVEDGVAVKGFDIDKERIILDRRKPFEAIQALNGHLSKFKAGKELIQGLGVLVLGVLCLVLLLTGSEKSGN